MFVLRIEHAIRDYAEWRAAFERDPIGRERMGVRRYRIMQPVDDAQRIMVDLEFDTAGEAEACEAALRQLWGRVDLARDPQARLVEVMDTSG